MTAPHDNPRIARRLRILSRALTATRHNCAQLQRRYGRRGYISQRMLSENFDLRVNGTLMFASTAMGQLFNGVLDRHELKRLRDGIPGEATVWLTVLPNMTYTINAMITNNGITSHVREEHAIPALEAGE